MINEVTFNNVNFWEELGVVLKDPPSYPIPAEIKEQVKVKGANGSLTESTGYFNDLELKLSFRKLTTFGEPQYKQINAFKYKINTIFNNVPTTQSNLIFSEVPNKYYKVKSCKVGAVTKISQYEYDFEVDFICDPFLYNTNERKVTEAGSIEYSGDIPNAPIIKINFTGTGGVTLLCNGERLTFTTKQTGMHEINANPFSIVTREGKPLESEGTQPILRPGMMNNIQISGVYYSSIEITKNERYLG